MIFLFFAVVLFGFSLFLFISYRQKKLLLLPNIFITMNVMFFLSLIFITKLHETAHLLLLRVHVTAIASFCIGVVFIRIIEPSHKKKPCDVVTEDRTCQFIQHNFYLKRMFAWFLLFFSIALGILYYKLIGYNLALLGVMNLFHEGTILVEDAATLRLGAYAGERYLAPGYFNQFKNIIAVILWQYLFSYYVIHKSKKMWILVLFLPLIIFLLVGTGQRGAFTFAVVNSVLFFSTVHKHNILKITFIAAIIFFTFFTMTSALIGRGFDSDQKFARTVSQGFKEINKRVFLDNAFSAKYGFEYILENNIPPQFFKETSRIFMNLLPFNKQKVLTIDSEIFESKYGSRRGTSPLSAAGNVWYDARIWGVAIFYIILGIIYTILSNQMENNKDLFVASCWAYTKVVLGFWLYGNLMTIIYNGIFTIVLLIIINKLLIISNKALSLPKTGKYQ